MEGRVAIMTGAGRGIGRGHALLFTAEGAKVVVNDVGGAPDGSGSDATPAQGVADEITVTGGDVIANAADVTSMTTSPAPGSGKPRENLTQTSRSS